MDIGPNPSSQIQCRASSLLSEPLLFFKRGREMLMLQMFRTAKLNEMFTALWKVFDAQKMLRPFWLRGRDLVLQPWNKVKVKVAQSCPTLCDPMVCSPPGSSVHGILQARILEWVAIPFSRGSSQPRDGTQVSCIAGRFFANWTTREAQCCSSKWRNRIPTSTVLIDIESHSRSCLKLHCFHCHQEIIFHLLLLPF